MTTATKKPVRKAPAKKAPVKKAPAKKPAKQTQVDTGVQRAAEIQKLAGEGSSVKELAAKYTVSESTVRRILQQRTFRSEPYRKLSELSAKDIAAIRQRLEAGEKTGPIAADYNVARSTIRKVRTV